MGADQTTIQNEKAVQIGSAAIFFSTDNGSSFTNLGLANDVAFTEEITPLEPVVNNGTKPRLARGVASQTASVTANLIENDYANIAALRGGIDVISTSTGAAIAGATQTVVSGKWEYDKPFELTINSSVAPSAVSVTGSVDGALVENTDFFVVKLGATKYGIYVIDSVTVTTEAQDLDLVYTYTPVIGTTVTTGGLVIQDNVWVRIYNRTPDTADAVDASEAGITEGDAIYRTVEYNFYYGTVSAGDAQTYKDKNDTDPIVVYPLAMAFENDPDRNAGSQLYEKKKYIELRSAVTL